MRHTLTACTLALAALSLGACSKSKTACSACAAGEAPVVKAASKEQQAALLDRVKSLAGEWESKDEQGNWNVTNIYTVSSNGSAVREVMFPGTSHEMTNMYTMDGPSLVVTHYCAMGNQPKMRCTAATANTIPFEFDTVSNLRSSDEMYMGSLTLVFVDNNTLQQQWKSYKQDVVQKDHCPTFELRRKK